MSSVTIAPNNLTIGGQPAIVAPPPPYHIAILLPENPKEPADDSPPPSYDKIVI